MNEERCPCGAILEDRAAPEEWTKYVDSGTVDEHGQPEGIPAPDAIRLPSFDYRVCPRAISRKPLFGIRFDSLGNPHYGIVQFDRVPKEEQCDGGPGGGWYADPYYSEKMLEREMTWQQLGEEAAARRMSTNGQH
jgi:hypothetical protein